MKLSTEIRNNNLFLETISKLSKDEKDKIKKPCIDMSLNLAKRYLDISFIFNLRKASNAVINCLAIGLYELNGGDLDGCKSSLIENSPVDIFRKGWTGLVKTIGLVDYSSNKEENILKFLFENYEKESIVYHYIKKMEENIKIQNELKYKKYFFKHFGVKYSPSHSAFNTFFISLFIGEKPKLEINITDEQNLIMFINKVDISDDFEKVEKFLFAEFNKFPNAKKQFALQKYREFKKTLLYLRSDDFKKNQLDFRYTFDFL